ncbi:MAG: twitching motility protein PilT [Halolamina sp.]|uniref:PIN domain-containing protein n=1 Tax=Halolamina sp. TaxID=1940283 RepID=UPI002FC2D339
MRRTAVLDTNALMMPVELDIRVFDELDRLLGAFEAVTPHAVLEELENLQAGHGEEATAAAVGRDLADRCTVVDTDASYADDAVIEVAESAEGEVYVVTNDRPLRDRLLAAGVDVIGLRGRNTLAITKA